MQLLLPSKSYLLVTLLLLYGADHTPKILTQTTCTTGFYYNSTASLCSICPAGSYCPSSSSVLSCAAGTYSAMGETTCAACPSGYYCPTTSDPPQICAVGSFPSADQLSCVTCSTGDYCPTPFSTTQTACVAPGFYQSSTGQTECLTCPAGYSCPTNTAATQCSSTGGYYAAFGTGSCSQSQKGYFTPNAYIAQTSCPTSTYSGAVGQTSCSLCDSGYSCSDQIGTKTLCTASTSFSPLGVTTCLTSNSPYYYDSSTSSINVPCASGSYMTSNSCTACPAGKICTDTAVSTSCPVGQYSTSGKGYCMTCAPFYACANPASPGLCSTSQYVNPVTSVCTNCPTNQVCQVNSQVIQTPRYCNPGFYRASATTCTICPEGYYCPAQATIYTICATNYVSSTGYAACVKCPAGYSCPSTKLSLITKCAAGTYAIEGAGVCTSCTAGNTCPETNIAGYTCPAGTFITAASSSANKCTLADNNYIAATTIAAETACSKTQYSNYGSTSCSTCPSGQPCSINRKGFLGDCAPGTSFQASSNTCIPCTAGSECLASTATTCPVGFMQKSTGQFSCPECPDLMICAQAGGSVINNWCYGKQSGQSVITEFTDANRFPYYNYQYCIDCNANNIPNQLCTFATNYFTTQPGSNLTCPSARSDSYYHSINNVFLADFRYWETDTTISPFPYCKTRSAAQSQVSSLTAVTDCKTNAFYNSPFQMSCLPVYPGFYSTSRDHQTEIVISSGVSMLSQTDSGTLTQMLNCPSTTESVISGAGSVSQGCMIKPQGQCDYVSASDYCHDGYDGQCNLGFNVHSTSSSPDDNFNDCYQCAPGVYCSSDETERNTTCDAGRFCLDVTEDEKQYASRPGSKITSTGSTSFSAETVCGKEGYCPQESSAAISCPAGYNLNVNSEAHSQYNCQPNLPGEFNSSSGSVTTCTAGSYCPEAVQASSQMIPCPPGHYSDSTGLIDKSSCTACPAGKFCPAQSTSSQEQNCQGGFNCPNRTRHMFENPCPAGTYSSSTLDAQSASQCTACPAGSYCMQGSSAPTTCPKNTYCPINTELPIDCPIGYSRSSTGGQSLTDCTACSVNQLCLGGADPIACPAGYNGFNSATSLTPSFLACLTTDSNHYTSTAGTTETTCADGYYTPQGKSTQCIACPAGYYCAAGVKTLCTAGQLCPQGTSSPVSCPAGTVCYADTYTTVYNNSFSCFPGQYCPTGSSTGTTTPAGYYNLLGDSSGTARECGNGYTCPGGSIGPYDTPCPVNTYASASTQTCQACDNGKYCPKGSASELDCPQGYYCDNTKPFPIKCPAGTYGATTNLASESACTPCPGGYYCPMDGQTTYTLKCDAGYYCTIGSFTPQPDETLAAEASMGGLCPAGAVCPQGTSVPLACPAGTYNSFPGMRSVSDCISCTQGYYCTGSTNSVPDGLCTAGYYCPSGSSIATQNPTQAGYYSLSGSSIQIKCEPGTYQDQTAQTSCKSCPSGLYCNTFGMGIGIACPMGYYCPARTVEPVPCPVGTYNPSLGQSGNGACISCDGGYFCDQEGLTYLNTSAICSAGYFCTSGSPSATPAVNLTLSINSAYVTQYGICPRGSYCPSQSTTPIPCPIGYYLNGEGGQSLSDCVKCQAGQYCDVTGLVLPAGSCTQGYFCGAASTSATSTACPKGSYCPTESPTSLQCLQGTFAAATAQSTCSACDAGNYCLYGASSETTCPVGAYCPSGTQSPFQYLCPIGTYNDVSGLTDSSACLTCPVDKYCKQTGTSTTDTTRSGLILPGYYNSQLGSQYQIPITGSLCSQGQTCNGGVETACPPGQYCGDQKLSSPSGNCQPGYFCGGGAKYQVTIHDSVTDSISVCSIGNYCLSGATAESPCPVGTFSSGTGLQKLADCSPCPVGYICDTVGLTLDTMNKCPNTLFCAGSVQSQATTTTCPTGAFCNQNNIVPQTCDKGTYNSQTDQSSCTTCPSGKYCDYGSVSPTALPSGYYQNATGQAVGLPCPAGSFVNTDDSNQCDVCPLGTYCDQYLLQSSTVARQCPAGYYCSTPGVIDYQTLYCTPGYYCPDFTNKNICTAGSYCSGYGLTAPTGQCYAGYYCKAGSQIPNPTDNIQGNVCPVGYYCVEGSSTPTACPIGTYNDKTGASDSTFCQVCPDELSCTSLATYSPGNECPAGSYCVTLSGVLQSTPCEIGYFCPGGAPVKQICPAGSYQDETGQSACKNCPAGSYCYNSNNPITTPVTCPPGFYCPANTAFYMMYPCAAGTFNAGTGLMSSSSCTPCTVGSYCSQRGLSAPDGSCRDGRVCAAGSKTPQGSDFCPANSYCKAGVVYACPMGTYLSPQGLSDSSQCVQCPPGSYCPTLSTIQNCPAGYYCQGNLYQASDATPCTVGHYCPASSYIPQSCQPGTYQPNIGQSSCLTCPAGYFCTNFATSTPTPCTTDMTCPAGSIEPQPCPIGQYADSNNLCQSCPAGDYCWPKSGSNGIQGTCAAGYICNGGSYSPQPYANVDQLSGAALTTYNGPARRGYYSTDGLNQIACAASTFQPSRWSQSCVACYAGSYCPNTGMSSLTNYDCAATTLCNEGSSKVTGSSCPSGYTTYSGEANCMACEDGYFSTNSGVCQECPANYYCNNTNLQVNLPVQQKCIVGSDCPLGSPFEPLCAEGSYLINAQCQPCDIGYYCTGGVETNICTAGYFCQGGQSSPVPSGQLCAINKYCPHGTTYPRSCPTGYYRLSLGGIQVTDCVQCQAGYICLSNTAPYECPKGFYCPLGDSTPIACPIGTWSQSTALVAANDCQVCPAGYLCNKTNITDYSQYPCPLGKYCPQRAQRTYNCPAGTYRNTKGARSTSDCAVCPPGYYCLEGSINPTQCSDGTYCPEGSEYFSTCDGGNYCNAQTNYQEEICPTNYMCPHGAATPILCTGRLICQQGSEIGTLCGAGFYVQNSSYGFINECLACEAGTYSTTSDVSCQNCTAGYMCYGQTNRKYPTDYNLHHGEICPKGYYCPESSSAATACPVGTYNPILGAQSITQCLLCPADTFNDETGQSGCRACGAYATSIEGSSVCDCIGTFRTFSVADSSCRCMSGYDYVNPLTSISEGTQSSDTDCTPLVFARCDGEIQTRDYQGNCVSLTDCSDQCESGNGTRSQTTGICNCAATQAVDTTCNQNCRSNAASMVLSTSSTASLTTSVVNITINGKTVQLDLSQVGDMYGSFDCTTTTTTNCSIASASTSSSGFQGNYGTSSLISKASRRMLRQLYPDTELERDYSDENEDQDNFIEFNNFTALYLSSSDNRNEQVFGMRKNKRRMQTASADTNAISDPVYCLTLGTSMLFTIENPNHYPVYLKDSVMNSNPSFDYGQFLVLQTSMTYKIAQNSTAASVFAFTFNSAGSYVFADASDYNKIMLVKVMDSGETCSDTDRYIQPLSSDSVSSIGVKQNQDIIIKPDIPLLVSIGAILIVSIGTVMVGVGYCLHKGWSIKRVIVEGYRSLYGKVDINHQNERTFQKDNDFEKFKSHMGDNSDSEEDDLDNINLDIHQDLIEAGQNYLKEFDDKKLKRIDEKKSKKKEILKLMKELEDMIGVIGSDAMQHQMQIYNEKKHGVEDSEHDQLALMIQLENEDPEQAELKRQKLQQMEEEKERLLREAEAQKREKMMNEWSDRDRQKLLEAQDKIKNNLEVLKKEFNSDGNKQNISSGADDLALALYDGGDPNSRHNQIVRSIENNANLSEEEKENLLRQHQKQLMQIDELMDQEKRKQDDEMERALKERIEKRRRALEAKHKKEIQGEIKDGEKLLKEEIEKEREKRAKTIDEDVQVRMDELTNNLKEGQAANYRQWVEDLKKEREQRKQQMNQQIDDELAQRMKKLRDNVLNKYTQGANNDEELEQLLRGENLGMDQAIDELKKQKMDEESKLREALKKRKMELKKKQQDEKEKFDIEIMTKDPLVEEELEKKKRTIDQNNGGSRLDDITQQNSSVSLDKHNRSAMDQQQPDSKMSNHKDEAQANFSKLLQDIDTQGQASHLLDALGNVDSDIALLLRDNEDEQNKKLDARRQLLRQRKMLKMQQEQEQARINERLAQLQMEADEKDRINKNFVKELFKKQEELGNNDPSVKSDNGANTVQQKLLLLNEFSSDAFLQRLSNLLMKQFLEKEAQLKLLLQKYMDEKLIEKNNLKEQFNIQYDKLNQLRESNQITEPEYQEALKNLRLKEENLLRDIDLQFDMAMKEEEAKLREQLERKHADEQIDIKKKEVEDQLKLKKELMLSDESNKREEQKELDQLKAFEHAKKREVDKKIRNLGVQKQEIIRQIQKDIDHQYSDYEDLLKRKRDEESALQEQALNIRKKLQDRKKKLKDQGIQEMSQDDQRKMIENYNRQLQALESVFEEEKRRQIINMKKRQQQRKVKQEKFKNLKELVEEQELDAIKNELGHSTFGDGFFKPGENDQQEAGLLEEDDELLKRLKEWRENRKVFMAAEEEKKLAETVIDLDQLTLKKLILKLDNLERCLRELRKIRKYDIQRYGPGYFQSVLNKSGTRTSSELQKQPTHHSEKKQNRAQTDFDKNQRSATKIVSQQQAQPQPTKITPPPIKINPPQQQQKITPLPKQQKITPPPQQQKIAPQPQQQQQQQKITPPPQQQKITPPPQQQQQQKITPPPQQQKITPPPQRQQKITSPPPQQQKFTPQPQKIATQQPGKMIQPASKFAQPFAKVTPTPQIQVQEETKLQIDVQKAVYEKFVGMKEKEKEQTQPKPLKNDPPTPPNKAKQLPQAAKFITDPKPGSIIYEDSVISGKPRATDRQSSQEREVVIEKTEGKKIDYTQFKKFVKKR